VPRKDIFYPKITRKAPAFRPEMDSVDAEGVLFFI
jgi:hypothetical protein